MLGRAVEAPQRQTCDREMALLDAPLRTALARPEIIRMEESRKSETYRFTASSAAPSNIRNGVTDFAIKASTTWGFPAELLIRSRKRISRLFAHGYFANS
jgi:hypothetical protein